MTTVATIGAAVLLSGCTQLDATPTGPAAAAPASVTATPTSPTAPAGEGTALAALATLPVHAAGPMTGYSRAQYGAPWADVDHNGCDTRDDILTRDLTNRSYRPGTHQCVVVSGTLADPYSGQTLPFTKTHATAVQIDHVVALGQAWITGADAFTATQRLDLANDPLELLAVDGPNNEAKGDDDASTWLPPHHSYDCSYAARQVAVKVKYRLWTTPAEHVALGRVLSSCPQQALPQGTEAGMNAS